jgi:hypothetical protein
VSNDPIADQVPIDWHAVAARQQQHNLALIRTALGDVGQLDQPEHQLIAQVAWDGGHLELASLLRKARLATPIAVPAPAANGPADTADQVVSQPEEPDGDEHDVRHEVTADPRRQGPHEPRTDIHQQPVQARLMGARGGEPATSAQMTHYTFVRDWHTGDGDAAVIAVKADLSLDDPYTDAEARAFAAGDEHWADWLDGDSFEDATFLVLVAFIDLNKHVDIAVLQA